MLRYLGVAPYTAGHFYVFSFLFDQPGHAARREVFPAGFKATERWNRSLSEVMRSERSDDVRDRQNTTGRLSTAWPVSKSISKTFQSSLRRV